MSAAVLKVHADERHDLVTQILMTGPLPCIDGFLNITSQQITRIAPRGILDGIAKSANLGNEWRKGQKHYQQAYRLISEALENDIVRNGPLVGLKSSYLIDSIFVTQSDADLRYLADFFASAAGKVYWRNILDGAQCSGWLKGVELPPFLPVTFEQEAKLEVLKNNAKTTESKFITEFNLLSSTEKKTFDTAHRIMKTRLINWENNNLTKESDEAVRARIVTLMEPYMQKITVIIQDFQNREKE